MALPMLVGGSECGPSNPLQGLSKRFDQDRGLQQDYFGAARAGSSREAFRSQHHAAGGSAPDQEAQRFFNGAQAGGAHAGPIGQGHLEAAFDVSAMCAALASPGPMVQQQPQMMGGAGGGAAIAAWASDFMMQQQTPIPQSSSSSTAAATLVGGVQQHQPIHGHVQSPGLQNGVPWNPAMAQFRMNTMSGFAPQMHSQAPAVTNKRISWDREFNAQELNLAPTTLQEPLQDIQHPATQESNASRKEFEGDELSRTAGLLLEYMKDEQNPKFQKSQFMNLMKQFRDGEAIVDGNKVVEGDGTRTSSSIAGLVDIKGKGRAIDPLSSASYPQMGANILLDYRQQQQPQDSKTETVSEDANDAYFRQENAEYAKYWNDAEKQREQYQTIGSAAAASQGLRNPEEAMWDKLQGDWDRFEATATGVKPVSQYVFQTNNPYMLGESSRTRNHMMHMGERQMMLESVLELEAAVQRDPSNATLWYELGVKQQENERESKALEALQRSVQLDPSLLNAWLALAISYTNDNDRFGTLNAVTEWVDRNEKYRHAAEAFRAANPQNATNVVERFEQLIQCLIAMARSDASGEVDADIQIALAVLLNTHEDYEKAQDCFKTALAVRPDDWLLYNRVGATMANSGRAEEAIGYYYKALELNPGYIRARFNLGISCMNLRRYDEAAQHILDALLLQDSDATTSAENASQVDKRDLISQALWVSLKTTCLHLQRPDLANFCDMKDLEAFRNKFYS